MQNTSLPTYSMRLSKKARYLQLRIRAKRLEVIVPANAKVSLERIEQFLLEKRVWIARHLVTQPMGALPDCPRPEAFTLHSMEEHWRISYSSTLAKRTTLKLLPTQQLVIEGVVTNTMLCVKMLKRWLKLKASEFLDNRLTYLSGKTQLPFAKLATRDMMSRWGSCSSQKNITLCVNLIFLPLHLVDHVILHELCHTKYMSHGKRFWHLLERHDVNARSHARELRHATQFIPEWALKV